VGFETIMPDDDEEMGATEAGAEEVEFTSSEGEK
jgi:hypothetical protein